MGVTFITPDRKPFVDLVQPLRQEMQARSPEFKRLIEEIESK
jgi:hypothetical protein